MGLGIQRLMRKVTKAEPVIVVSGLPRSGTSMAMKMLEAGGLELMTDGIRSADVDNPRGYFELERVKELDKGGDKTWLREARGRAVKIISFLLPHLPPDNDYKVIFMERDLGEVLASQGKMLEHRQETSETEDATMRAHYREHLKKIEFILARRDHFSVLRVTHRDVLADPQGQAERMAEFLDRTLDVEKMVGVVDPALYRNRA